MSKESVIYRIVVHPEPDFTVQAGKGMYFWFIAAQGTAGVVFNAGCGWAESMEQALVDAKAYLANLSTGSKFEDISIPLPKLGFELEMTAAQEKRYHKLCAETADAHMAVFVSGSPVTYKEAMKKYRRALANQLLFEMDNGML